jgi:hypothetical protein
MTDQDQPLPDWVKDATGHEWGPDVEPLDDDYGRDDFTGGLGYVLIGAAIVCVLVAYGLVRWAL